MRAVSLSGLRLRVPIGDRAQRSALRVLQHAEPTNIGNVGRRTEDVAAQRARVNVIDAITRRGLSGVHVKIIGTGMNRFVSGETDLRGLYVAEALGGYPTAIARDAVGHFAFYRSAAAAVALGPTVERAGGAGQPPAPANKADYRKNLAEEQQQIQTDNGLRLKSMLEKKQKGVEVKSSQ